MKCNETSVLMKTRRTDGGVSNTAISLYECGPCLWQFPSLCVLYKIGIRITFKGGCVCYWAAGLKFVIAPNFGRLRLKCDGTRAETRFRLSAKQRSPFKSVGESVQSTTGSQVVRISRSNAGNTLFRGSVKGTGYPLLSPFSPSLPLPCVTVCHHVSTGLYNCV